MKEIGHQCFPIESDIISMLAQSCTRIQHLEISSMNACSNEARNNMSELLRQIIFNKPPLTQLNLKRFSDEKEGIENVGEVMLEALLYS